MQLSKLSRPFQWVEHLTTISLLSIFFLSQAILASTNHHQLVSIRSMEDDFFVTPNETSVLYFGVPYRITWRTDYISKPIVPKSKVQIQLWHGTGLGLLDYFIYNITSHEFGEFETFDWTPQPKTRSVAADKVYAAERTYEAYLEYAIGGGENSDSFEYPRQFDVTSKKFELNFQPPPSESSDLAKTNSASSTPPSTNTVSAGGLPTSTTSQKDPPSGLTTVDSTEDSSKDQDNHWVITAAVGGSLGGVIVILAAILIFVLVQLLPRVQQKPDLPVTEQAEFISMRI